jgi:hypothetical protein
VAISADYKAARRSGIAASLDDAKAVFRSRFGDTT